MAHVFPHVIAGLVAVIEKVVRTNLGNDTGPNVIPFGGITRILTNLDEVAGFQHGANGNETRENGLIAF
jgi:hypothetical protein